MVLQDTKNAIDSWFVDTSYPGISCNDHQTSLMSNRCVSSNMSRIEAPDTRTPHKVLLLNMIISRTFRLLLALSSSLA